MEVLLRSALYSVSLLFLIKRFSEASDDFKHKNGTSKVKTLIRLFNKSIPKDYQVQEAPSEAVINIGISLIGIPSVEFSRMEFEAEFIFVATWRDERITFDGTEKEMAEKHEILSVPDVVTKRLWVPRIVFSECKQCKTGIATGEQPLFFIPKSGKLMIMYRDTMFFGCRYDLTRYPFDVHECGIIVDFLDVIFTNSVMKLKDSYTSFFMRQMENAIAPGLPSEFYFEKLFVKQNCTRNMLGRQRTPDQCLNYGVRFRRIASYYLMQIYTPSFIIVLISWISFWLEIDSPAPRVTLGLTSLLTLTAQFSTAQKDLPPVAYIKALDVWMIMCCIMVFGSLLEFSLAYAHRHKIIHPVISVNEPKATACDVNESKLLRDVKKPKKVNWLDAKAKVVFPAVFLLFNVIYWPYYIRRD